MNVVITGATGLIGTEIANALLEADHNVIALSRKPLIAAAILPRGVVCLAQDDDAAIKHAVTEAETIINLAGESIGGARWTPAYKERLRSSRIQTTRRLVEAILESSNSSDMKPPALINASAVGYYGDCGDAVVTEEHVPGTDFLATLCRDWEAEASRASSAGSRVVVMRIGLVMAKTGVLDKILYPLPIHVSPFKLGLGGPMGNGKQWWSWAHIADVVGMFVWAATHAEVSGAFNLTAPEPVTSTEFASILGRALHRPAVLPVPAFALRAIVGEFSQALLTGQRAIPAAAQQAGYSFKYANLADALESLLQ